MLKNIIVKFYIGLILPFGSITFFHFFYFFSEYYYSSIFGYKKELFNLDSSLTKAMVNVYNLSDKLSENTTLVRSFLNDSNISNDMLLTLLFFTILCTNFLIFFPILLSTIKDYNDFQISYLSPNSLEKIDWCLKQIRPTKINNDSFITKVETYKDNFDNIYYIQTLQNGVVDIQVILENNSRKIFSIYEIITKKNMEPNIFLDPFTNENIAEFIEIIQKSI